VTVRGIAGRLAGFKIAGLGPGNPRKWYRIAVAVTAIAGLAALVLAASGQLFATGSAGFLHP
jgi:hypothetical protein